MIDKSTDVPAINKMNLIFNLLAEEPQSLSQTAICNKLDLPKATVFRLTNTLHSMGYLDQDAKTGFYRLGAKLLTLGNTVKKRLNLNTVSTPFIEELSYKLNEMIKISILRGDVVYPVKTCESRKAIRITLDSEAVFPPYIGAAGKLLLALTQDGQNYCKETLPWVKMIKFTDYTITDCKRLTESIKIIQKEKIAFDNQEETEGIYAIAAPIYNSNNEVIAAISIPFFGNQNDKKQRYLPLLQECARNISDALGYSETSIDQIESEKTEEKYVR